MYCESSTVFCTFVVNKTKKSYCSFHCCSYFVKVMISHLNCETKCCKVYVKGNVLLKLCNLIMKKSKAV